MTVRRITIEKPKPVRHPLRVSPELDARIRQAAEGHRSINAAIIYLIEQGLEHTNG